MCSVPAEINIKKGTEIKYKSMIACVRGAWVDGCYLTDVGSDASLPEALAAELHRHLTAHGVLLTDLLKSFLPNNQPVNY